MKIHGKDTCVFLDAYDITRYQNQTSISLSQQLVVVTSYKPPGDDEEYIAGKRDGNMSFGGLFDVDPTATPGGAELIEPLFGTDVPITVVLGDTASIGDDASITHSWLEESGVRSPVNDAVRTTGRKQGATMTPRLGAKVLHTKTSEAAPANFASYDWSALNTNGLSANLHVISFTGTTATIKVTDSATDTVFADYITFAAVTGPTAETVLGTTQVERYTRVELTGTFTEITFVVAAVGNAR